MISVMAGIISFNPDIERLRENITAIKDQVEEVCVSDNDSDNKNEVKKLCDELSVTFMQRKTNGGISPALNEIFRYAISRGSSWVITLDQDSVCSSDYIEKASRYFDFEKIGIITTLFYDSNLGAVVSRQASDEKYEYVKRAITSAAVVNVKAYQDTCGYDENMFVDYVDFDFSVQIRQAGYNILKMNDTLFRHELGVSKMRRFLLWKFRMTSHSPLREYYIAKNIIIFTRKYKGKENLMNDYLSLCKHFVLSATYDENKKEKIKALINGVRDGRKYEIPRKSGDNK